MVSLAVIGLGRWGANYCRTIEQLPDCSLAAVADADPSRLEQTRVTARRGDVASILADSTISAVVLATPGATHFDLTSAALLSGKDVLVEKPMALSTPQAVELARLADKTDRIVAVGHTSVYSSGFAAVHRAHREHPATMSAERTSDGGRADADLSVIWDLAPHDLAMAVLLAGRPVAARLLSQSRSSAVYEVKFESSTVLRGRVAWQYPSVRDFRWSDGNSELRCEEPTDGNAHFAALPLTRQCSDFANACRDRRRPVSDVGLGLSVTSALCAISTSAGDWVSIAEGQR